MEAPEAERTDGDRDPRQGREDGHRENGADAIEQRRELIVKVIRRVYSRPGTLRQEKESKKAPFTQRHDLSLSLSDPSASPLCTCSNPITPCGRRAYRPENDISPGSGDTIHPGFRESETEDRGKRGFSSRYRDPSPGAPAAQTRLPPEGRFTDLDQMAQDLFRLGSIGRAACGFRRSGYARPPTRRSAEGSTPRGVGLGHTMPRSRTSEMVKLAGRSRERPGEERRRLHHC